MILKYWMNNTIRLKYKLLRIL